MEFHFKQNKEGKYYLCSIIDICCENFSNSTLDRGVLDCHNGGIKYYFGMTGGDKTIDSCPHCGKKFKIIYNKVIYEEDERRKRGIEQGVFQ